MSELIEVESRPCDPAEPYRSAEGAVLRAGQLAAKPDWHECRFLLAREFNEFIGRLTAIDNEEAESETTERVQT